MSVDQQLPSYIDFYFNKIEPDLTPWFGMDELPKHEGWYFIQPEELDHRSYNFAYYKDGTFKLPLAWLITSIMDHNYRAFTLLEGCVLNIPVTYTDKVISVKRWCGLLTKREA